MIAVLPAHNEAAHVGAAIAALRAQTTPPERVIVICDNCTDSTSVVALEAGAEVWQTVNNADKKAGALNQALDRLLPDADNDDTILIQDADSVLGHDFAETALDRIARGASAVGGIFRAQSPGNILEHFQANEYSRYARELSRTGRVMVLTGTASVMTIEALRDVREARGHALPGRCGDIYDRNALTEDNELTLALKSRGHKLSSPLACEVSTEVMPTVADLMRQRIRWYRGALDNLRVYGWTPVTRRYWGQQLMLAIGVVAMWLYLLMTALTVAAGAFTFEPWWLALGVLFWIERVVTARRSTRTGVLLAALFVPELIYDALLQVAFVRAIWQSFTGAEASWHHINAPGRPTQPRVTEV